MTGGGSGLFPPSLRSPRRNAVVRSDIGDLSLGEDLYLNTVIVSPGSVRKSKEVTQDDADRGGGAVCFERKQHHVSNYQVIGHLPIAVGIAFNLLSSRQPVARTRLKSPARIQMGILSCCGLGQVSVVKDHGGLGF